MKIYWKVRCEAATYSSHGDTEYAGHHHPQRCHQHYSSSVTLSMEMKDSACIITVWKLT